MIAPIAAMLAIFILTSSAHADGLADCSQRADPQRTIDGCTDVLGQPPLRISIALSRLIQRWPMPKPIERLHKHLVVDLVTQPQILGDLCTRKMARRLSAHPDALHWRAQARSQPVRGVAVSIVKLISAIGDRPT